MADFVAYYRVSPGGTRKDKKLLRGLTADQQRDEVLSLQSQQNEVRRYLAGLRDDSRILNEYTEVESGRKHENRPQLRAAIGECKKHGRTLIIAKLDRLARNVHFISGLMDSTVDFVAVDMPYANRLTIHILAAVAEDERLRISSRIKAALAVLKSRGVKLGNPNLAEAREKSRLVPRSRASAVAPGDRMLIQEWKKQGYGLTEIAKRLNDGGSRAPKGGAWGISSVRNQLAAHTMADAMKTASNG